MKIALVTLMVLLPLAFAAPDKKFILPNPLDVLLNLAHVDTTAFKQDIQTMLDAIGSDPAEQVCESECHKLFAAGILDHGCPLVCNGFQSFVSHFHLVPDATATSK